MKTTIKDCPKCGKGYLVRAPRTGKIGRTYHAEEFVNGKIKVYLEGQKQNILVAPENLEVIGFAD